jgi:hypothetical protein
MQRTQKLSLLLRMILTLRYRIAEREMAKLLAQKQEVLAKGTVTQALLSHAILMQSLANTQLLN